MLGTIGDVVQDIVVWTEEDIRPATDTMSTITTTRGGSAANVAALAGRTYPTRFIGRVGEDIGGHVVHEELSSRNVDVRLQRGPQPTGIIAVIIDQEGERHMFPSRGASRHLDAVDPEWLDGLRLLHATGYSLETEPTATSVLEALKQVRAAGGQVSFDVSSVGMIESYGKERFKEALVGLQPDIISANGDESAYLDLAHGDRPGAYLQELPETTLIARDGAKPTRVFQGGALVEKVPVPPVEAVLDLTGAGDAFNAGYLVGVLEGKSQKEAVEAGHALSGTVISQPGATDGE